MLTAFVQNDVIVDIKDVTDEEYSLLAPAFQVAIDISEVSPVPDIGWRWNGTTFIDSVGVAVRTARVITKLSFRNRFTFAEKVALQTALNSSVEVQALYNDFQAAESVDLSRTDTIQGLGFLAQAGLITLERMNEILNAPIAASERWIRK